MVISAYYSHRDSHPLFPGLAEERKRLQEVEYTEGLKIIIDGIMSTTFHNMLDWPLELTINHKFEDVKSDLSKIKQSILPSPHENRPLLLSSANQALVRLGLQNPFALNHDFEWTKGSIDFHSNRYIRRRKTQKKSAERLGKTSHYQLGASNQWRKDMPEEVQNYFSEKFPGLVEKYNY